MTKLTECLEKLERLEGENERLKSALREIVELSVHFHPSLSWVHEVAQQALKEVEG